MIKTKRVPNMRRQRMRRNIYTVLGTLFLLLGFLLFFAARWYLGVYGKTGFDSILYTLFSDLGGVEPALITSLMTRAVLPGFLCAGIFGIVIFAKPRRRTTSFYPLPNWAAMLTASVLTVVLVSSALFITGGHLYIYDLFHESAIFDEEYVDPEDVEITFPEKKRNLIYIFLESMETTYFSEAQGGAEDVDLIPELYKLAEENINFSESKGVGGFRSPTGTTWTIGAMVAHTAGVPLKTPANVDDWQNGYGKEGVFLPGLTNLSDILHENGYYQSLMVGSVASFGGRKVYYETHGTDTIYELTTARKDGIVPGDYFVWWGMEDKYLFEYAKQELTEISKMDQPFAFTMLTVDTHHVGGYICEYCGSEHEEQYENVISCSSKQVLEFVEWIQAQPFYENTTVIICGDHPSMDKGYFKRNIDESYTRRIYNCFINAPIDTKYSKDREFTSLDMFPTTLAAMGCTIQGDRLGLGTNLFSGKKTLTEEMGYDRFDRALSMKSEFYAVQFRQETAEQIEN